MSQKTKKIVKIEVIDGGSPPDVDSDFRTDLKDLAFYHVSDLYGKDNVANIITFTSLAAAGAFKSMCTIYKIPFAQANKISPLIPGRVEGVECTMEDIFNPDSDRYTEGADFRNATSGGNWDTIIDGAKAIEKRYKSTGIHACFPAGSLVKTSTGYTEIENIKNNDLVLTHRGRYQKVLEVFTTHTDKLYHIETERSLPIKATADHPILVRQLNSEPEWKNADSIIPNVDFIGIPPANLFAIEKNSQKNDTSSTYEEGKKIAENKDEINDKDISRYSTEELTEFLKGYFAGKKIDEKEEYSFTTSSKKTALTILSLMNKLYGKTCEVSMTDGTIEISLYKESLEKLTSFYDNDYVWALVSHVEVEEVNCDTYNLSVEEDNSYTVNNVAVHNCGVVISSKPLHETIPLTIRQSDERLITQWTYPECEAMGLIKFDFLGLKTIDLVHTVLKYIMKNGKKAPSMVELNSGEMNDKATFETFSSGHTLGIFQFGSPMVQEYCMLLKPEKFMHLADATALCRPGPMGIKSQIHYAQRKNGLERIDPIHKDFVGSPLDDILGPTYGLIVYQEQIQQITNRICGWTLQDGDKIRKAMGKKKKDVMDSLEKKFMEGGVNNGYSEEAMAVLWNAIMLFAKYGFNKCLHGRTKVVMADGSGKITIEELYKRHLNGEKNISILSMYEDGEIKPHTIKNIVQSGKKPLYTVKTKSGKSIRVTEDHRLLTTSGYRTIKDGGIKVGEELIYDSNWSKRISENTRRKRAECISDFNRTPVKRLENSERMKAYQATLTFEDRSAHQKLIQKNNPSRTDNWFKAGQTAYKTAKKKGLIKGKGIVTALSDGRECDSICEAMAAEYLISRGVDFELHKELISVHGERKYCDFYVDGLYFEMDGLGRGRDYFVQEKYGEGIPFVYMTPYTFKDAIDEALMSHHIANGDEITEIFAPKILSSGKQLNEMTYDIEMSDDGPSNFIANGVVSHNSHSVAYAMSSYQTAYLKTHYPVEFIAAVIAHNNGSKDEILTFLQEASRMGIKVGPTNINSSDIQVAPDFTGKSGYDIIYGLAGIDAIAEETAKIIINERERGGKYSSVQDVITRCVPLGVSNKKIYENLALSGAFDCFGVTRKSVVDNIELMLNDSKTKITKGASLFDMFADEDDSALEVSLSTTDEYSFVEKIKKEANVIGLYLTEHPLSRVGTGLSQAGVISIKNLITGTSTTTVNIVGSITEIETKRNRNGGKSVRIAVDDGTGYLKANLTRNVVKNIDKYNAQKTIEKLYMNGETTVPEEAKTLVLSEEFKAQEPINVNDVYVMNVTFRPGWEDSGYGVRVNSITPLNLSYDGSLPIRIRLKAKNSQSKKALEKKLKDFSAKVANKYPGNYSIHYSIFEEDEVKIYNDIEYYDKLIKVMESEKVSVSETTISDKPKTAKKESEKTSRELPLFSEETSVIGVLKENDIAEEVKYIDSGFKADKNSDIEELLSSKFGGERIDFGVFNNSMLDKEE